MSEKNCALCTDQAGLSSDSLSLEPLGPIGQVADVNGPGAVEVRSFGPTQHELLVLAEYWERLRLDINFRCFLYAVSDSDERPISDFAASRIDHIATAAGAEQVDSVLGEVRHEFSEDIDPRLWQMFLQGEEPPRDEHGVAKIE